MLNVMQTAIQDVFILEYEQRDDPRRAVFPNYSKRELEALGIVAEFVEEFMSCPVKRGTLYGIHFQNYPKAQTKCIACTHGRGLDYAIDLRPSSRTYKHRVCVELTPDTRRQMYIPKGCGHAFLTFNVTILGSSMGDRIGLASMGFQRLEHAASLVRNDGMLPYIMPFLILGSPHCHSIITQTSPDVK